MSKISYILSKGKEKENELYYIITGRIQKNYVYLLNQYDISDPNSESTLRYCIWDDYRNKEEYENFMVKHSDYYQTVTRKYTLDDLKESVLRFLIPKGQTEITSSVTNSYNSHLKKMEETYKNYKTDRLSTDEKKACALAISYYTGDKQNSDRCS
jgi:hypothetical protein